MFVYEKKLQYPVKIKNTNPALAKYIISQYGGPYGRGLRLQKFQLLFPLLRNDQTGCRKSDRISK